ncbi:MAG: hypothetical protein KAH00_05845 [Cocleimonas sp.]|nr:hypothetical protein [Cocleimonas sp.]
MYIVRWFVGHPIVALWALTIIALLLSMSGNKKQEEVVADSHEGTKATEVKHSGNTEAGKVDGSPKINADASPVATNEHVNVVKSDETPAAVVATSSQAATSNLLSPSNADAAAEKADQQIPMQGLGEKSIEDLLLMARESYWNNGLDEAAEIYQQLIQREPNVVEHKGELGNVYWKQGFPEKSADLYAEIALPMIKNGHADRVANMVGFIKLFHPEKAAEITKTLQGLGNLK